ncbi:MAG: ABC transporter ATP-binding protein [Gammaproteobacteria bacterium]|nr:ABC transporter ATP-binding protein [Gammaproteobacteria bacterium]
MIQIKDLVKLYGSPPQTVLNHVELNIPQGSVFGLLGPNGAGKTTLLSILLGLVPKTGGSVLFDGDEVEQHLAEVRASIGFVPQDFAFYPMLSARENLNFFAAAAGVPRALQKSQIDFCVHTTGLQNHIDKRAQNFSGGLKRRLNLAIGLLNQPKVLCLDEPTVGIDPHSRNFILEAITELNRQGMTIIYTSHYMEEVEQICDRVAIIDHGRILICGHINELLKSRNLAKLSVQMDKPLPANILENLRQRFSIESINETHIEVQTDDPLTVINALSPVLTEANLGIERIHYGFKNLEELFLTLTHKHLRDNADE